MQRPTGRTPKTAINSNETDMKADGFSAVIHHRGHDIMVGGNSAGWWARIDGLGVETMLYPDQAIALAEGMAFVDGFLTPARPAPRHRTSAEVLCGRTAMECPAPANRGAAP